MPYIEDHYKNRAMCQPENVGELTYAFTKLIVDYADTKIISFEEYAKIVGSLELAKLELWKRAISPYEDKKQSINGDVFPPKMLRP